MAPTKPTDAAPGAGTGSDPIDLTGPSPARKGVVSGRVTKSTPKKTSTAATAAAAAAAATAPAAGGDNNDDEPAGAGSDNDNEAAATPTRRRVVLKATYPACRHCRRAKARCDRIASCERCDKAGVACSGSVEDAFAGGGKPIKACDRCRQRKVACVRKDTCKRCERKGIECVPA
ncbi:91623474-1e76-4e15-ba14-3549199a58d7 [Thermothielavioides terrestris]|uniref:91623474-1e76-4e15-ba14-3549199a58d7 n=1 Tax=Thermothielavioides terrestris TaxID=2587410 RepID=A0A446BNK2_9PEZI|nr:91623474-1e76-4e15-ba14-3549199a58d7 [Thermothielavioides terrestris]